MATSQVETQDLAISGKYRQRVGWKKKLMGSYITHARAINTHTRTRIKGEKEIERESEIEKEHFLASYRSGWWRKVIPAKPTSEEEEETKVVGKIYFACCSSLGEALCTQPRRKKESCVCVWRHYRLSPSTFGYRLVWFVPIYKSRNTGRKKKKRESREEGINTAYPVSSSFPTSSSARWKRRKKPALLSW